MAAVIVFGWWWLVVGGWWWWIAVAGLLAGLAIATGLVRLLQSGLELEAGSGDPVAFSVAVAISALTTAAASYFPARRAIRIDPAVALRPE